MDNYSLKDKLNMWLDAAEGYSVAAEYQENASSMKWDDMYPIAASGTVYYAMIMDVLEDEFIQEVFKANHPGKAFVQPKIREETMSEIVTYLLKG